MNEIMCSSPSEKGTRGCVVNVTISDIILTPLTCSSIINELIKLLVYQKSQIPYPYNWLKSAISRQRHNMDENKLKNVTVEQHFRVVSAAYNVLQDLAFNLDSEFKSFGSDIKQVLIVFGATVYCPKEVFRICLSGCANGHLENNHLFVNSKKQHKVLREIVLAEEWILAMETSIPPTNMFILIQKKNKLSRDDNFFQLIHNYSEPLTVRNLIINLEYDHNIINNCCKELKVFNDESSIEDNVLCSKDNSSSCSEKDGSLLWYQAKGVLQGFRQCYVNKVSATELW